jgi:hypothetical protein
MNKVKTGQKFSVKAETWNSFIDAADFVKQQQADMNSSISRKDTKSGIVMIRNGADDVLEQFKVISLGDLIIKPADNEQEFRCNLPVFEAETVSDDNKKKPFAVLQKPLAKSECGLAMVSGITPVPINIVSAGHEYAELSADGLMTSETGSIRILWKETGTGDKWAVVHIGAASQPDAITAVNYDGVDIPANSAVVVAGTEYLEDDEGQITFGNMIIKLNSARTCFPAITLSEFKAGGTGAISINKPAKCMVSISDGGHAFAQMPEANFGMLQSGSWGEFMILHKLAESGQCWCCVLPVMPSVYPKKQSQDPAVYYVPVLENGFWKRSETIKCEEAQ